MNRCRNLTIILAASIVAILATVVLTLAVNLQRSLATTPPPPPASHTTPRPPNWPWHGIVMQQKISSYPSTESGPNPSSASSPKDIGVYFDRLHINSVHLYLDLKKYCEWKYGGTSCDADQTWIDLVAGGPKYESWLDKMLDECRYLGITAIVTLNSVPTAATVNAPSYYTITSAAFWENTDGKSLGQLYGTVQQLAEHMHGYNLNHSNNPVLYAYDIIGEPTEYYPAGSKTAIQPEGWQSIQDQIVQQIRTYDADTPPAWVVVKPGPDGGRMGYCNNNNCPGYTNNNPFQPLLFNDLVYSVHVYDPHVYTHQGINDRYQEIGLPYPGTFTTVENGRVRYDEAEVVSDLSPVKAFVDQAVPSTIDTPFYMYVGEFGAVLWACDSNRWLHDMVDIWNNWMSPAWGWAYFAQKGYPAWSPQYTYIVDPSTVPEQAVPNVTFSAAIPASQAGTVRATDLGAMFGQNPYPTSEGLCEP